ncbi:N-acetyltransferase [Kribbella antibiotica]|uniref:N-acetyltransferase n=1 Tax=Kribbella antibiotica TaxID=190195 RepID=A0A4R4ZKM8_9ACTN|nr:GNAT family N-acetyltransferase [Kribbella antibiotica]TDD59105.1 N-acetyltransferase [Kribbella antibiotica]
MLSSSRLQLREWRSDEAQRISTARTNQATAHFLPFIPQPFTVEDVQFWLKDMAEQRAAGTRFNWCVADAATDLGLGNLTLFRMEEGSGELGFWLHPDAQGRGVIVEAIELVAHWFFAAGHQRLWIKTASTNGAARRTAERSGFRLVRTEPDAYALASGRDAMVAYERTAQVDSGS